MWGLGPALYKQIFKKKKSSPKPPENSIGVTSNFFRGSRCTTGINDTVANLPVVSTTLVANSGYDIRLLTPERELEGKIYLYGNSTTQRCPNTLIEDIFHLPQVLMTLVVHLELRISPQISR
jgi:hypothetical protein